MKICLFTATRAEYGIMKNLIKKLDQRYQLDIVVSGTHLEEKYGSTYKFIEQDGFRIARKIPLNMTDTSKKTLGQTSAVLAQEINQVFAENNYDLLVLLGDRYELLPVVNMALIHNIPICHLHGGEKTLGNYDEMIRHAVTKMSHLHLVAAEEFKQRVLQLGEAENRVHNIGSLGVENILTSNLLPRQELAQKLETDLAEEYYVVVFHPVTLENKAEEQINELLSALSENDMSYYFIGSNADTDSDVIMNKIQNFVNKNPKSKIFTSLASTDYHSLVQNSKGLVGNSSSGIIEAPSLKVATLDIGNRQKGRLRGPSVINVPCEKEAILQGLADLEKVEDFTNPYEKDSSSDRAIEAIIKFLGREDKLVKDFCDK
ncbi:MAG: UDP-N-acetylglucosamine 2-epimerase [Gemella sp.]|nr:UDP-N-acetylglucosamine 2-epimerase [Gemella sp.]